jgi:hypothetical protein
MLYRFDNSLRAVSGWNTLFLLASCQHIDLEEIAWDNINMIYLAQDKYRWRIVASTVIYYLIIKPTRCTNFSNLFKE